ncbi:lytic transglycosylase domain-containing protein [Niveispirillum sp.]|uniref:lytic transglycosylase domain-containing protein n=1 Tax=Niveispirillum sp. TaxID=1917217 RepID=UPI001B56A269|nr:lytic transglycosylase domain-containing protein [Niveispirillum sp.]MBP7339652.1 lytic transglycosylase domain-containing protein [Niveispirillum sp.]
MAALRLGGVLLAMVLAAPVLAVERSPYEAEIVVAAGRFDLPAAWIRAVIQVESGGDPGAVSPKGALGLMQLMPNTWAEMSDRHGIGSDVFDPAANIMAGTAYLAEMRDRFGYPGLFAAYNAGPARYQAHLREGRPLPAETRVYLTELSALVGAGEGRADKLFVPLNAADGRLFAPLSNTGGKGR